MGRKVTMFFTFWGLNVLGKPARSRSARRFSKNVRRNDAAGCREA
jgi:peroxiredoxin family protein